ncbi:hypothetical protein F5Y19DRAFT_477980 [Xylariaceae sp. FL1651]|nr:hypothetical protein F5Y19DRAFT_477980 [Xylariaceae sp. FL1651]
MRQLFRRRQETATGGTGAEQQPPERILRSIVFVHGLTGDRENAWTARGASEPWPKALLPAELPTARVLTFGYDAYVADWSGVNERPIMFLCHSLAGLVCEDALVKSRERPEPHLQNILRSTRGIAFLGTPHHGAGLARWAELLARASAWSSRQIPIS